MTPALKNLETRVNVLARPVILLEGRRVVAEVPQHTLTASPQNRGVIENRHKVPALGKKAIYLLRDTLKVMGSPNWLDGATAAFF